MKDKQKSNDNDGMEVYTVRIVKEILSSNKMTKQFIKHEVKSNKNVHSYLSSEMRIRKGSNKKLNLLHSHLRSYLFQS